MTLFQPMHLLLFLFGGVLLVVLLLIFILILLKNRPPAVPPTNLDPQARLERLATLKQKALISDDEYETTRQRILGEL